MCARQRVHPPSTRRRPRPALDELAELARAPASTLRFDAEESRKHDLRPADGLELDATSESERQLVLRARRRRHDSDSALRAYAGTTVPVFGVNFGEIGFLAAVEREEAVAGFERALAGDLEVLPLPGLVVSGAMGGSIAINDVSIHRKPGNRVAEPRVLGRPRRGGPRSLRRSGRRHPAGSTGYNLANGGPVMAWGVKGFAVSFIAPHSLTARALVVAPGDACSFHNGSREEAVDVSVDGRPVAVLDPGEGPRGPVRRRESLAGADPGATFYQRLREKFGRLSTVP